MQEPGSLNTSDAGMHSTQNNFHEPQPITRLMSPVERISEILFGLIMALTFTCTISVTGSDQTEVREMLVAAIGCNIAWGLVDAVMYLLMTLTEKGHNLTIFNFVRKTKDADKAHRFIAEALPPVVAGVMSPGELEELRQRLLLIPEPPSANGLRITDYKIAIGIFLLVFLSTFPIAVPFLFISEVQTALRVSNLIAIVMMFLCGWFLGKYGGRNRLSMGFMMSLIGIVLVLLTISLGG